MWLTIYLLGIIPAALIAIVKVKDFYAGSEDIYLSGKDDIDNGLFAIFSALVWPLIFSIYAACKIISFISKKLCDFADWYISRRKK